MPIGQKDFEKENVPTDCKKDSDLAEKEICYKLYIWSVVLYRCEIWTVEKKEERQFWSVLLEKNDETGWYNENSTSAEKNERGKKTYGIDMKKKSIWLDHT